MHMSSQDRNEWLLDEIRKISEFLKDGRYNDIDFSSLEKEAPDLAGNFAKVVKNLVSAGETVGLDAHDIPKMNEYLTHISKTTETGVTAVLNIAETAMNDMDKVKDSLDNLCGENPRTTDPENVKEKINEINETIATLQNNFFTILTSLEFEDINRQLMEKIIGRLDEMYGNFLEMMALLNAKEYPAQETSTFLKALKRLFDIEDISRHNQKVADELFEEF